MPALPHVRHARNRLLVTILGRFILIPLYDANYRIVIMVKWQGILYKYPKKNISFNI